ncbi:MAG: GAF and ANTAR domain-containing protein [Acidimicrobiales bacterium]
MLDWFIMSEFMARGAPARPWLSAVTVREENDMAFREQRLSQAFVELADTLVDDFDVVDFMTLLTERCVDLLGATDGGLMLVDSGGHLRVVASSSEQMRTLELFELQASEGPCLDAYRTAEAVGADDAEAITRKWPAFSAHVLTAGYTSIYAVPLRIRSNVIGALNLFNTGQGPWDADNLKLAQALAAVATIGLLHHRAMDDSLMLSSQLQVALNSRISIEQAKGLLAGRLDIGTEEAFERIRRYARSHNLNLSAVATDLMAGTMPDNAMDQLTMPGNR